MKKTAFTFLFGTTFLPSAFAQKAEVSGNAIAADGAPYSDRCKKGGGPVVIIIEK